MKIKEALVVIDNLDDESIDEFEKAEAISEVIDMPTHMSVSKFQMLRIIRWLWNQIYEFESEDKNDTRN